MSMSLRRSARHFDDLFSFLMAFQGATRRTGRGCTMARELARVWYRAR